MNKRMVIMLVLTALLFGGVFGWKAFKARMMAQWMDNMPQPAVTVSATETRVDRWAQTLEAVGSFVAVHGTPVTTEAAGVVDAIRFESGQQVEAGEVLLTLDAATDRADLQSLQAAADLAELDLQRMERLFRLDSVPKSELDRVRSQAQQARARADAQRARVAQKTIRAPFAGELGIRQVNLGQYLTPGTAIVNLQSLDPIYVHFSLPEQRLAEVHLDQAVKVRTGAFAETEFDGRVTAIEPGVDQGTRNFNIQATVANPDRRLRPGMFARVSLETGDPQDTLVIPQTAVSFNPYGNSVYVLVRDGEGDEARLLAKRRFVRTGANRGDLVSVVDGLQAGDMVATSGLLKLRNDARVVINNEVEPSADTAPRPANR